MNGGKGKLLATVLIMMMVIMPFSMTIGSDASDADYSRYYYNQMSDDKLAQQIYDKTLGLAAVGSTTFVVELDLNLFSSKDNDVISSEIGKSMQKAINALSIERPETYWIDLSIKSNTTYTKSGSTGEIVSASTTFTYNKLANYPALSVANGQIDAAISAIAIDTTSKYATVKSIHDALASILTYSPVVNGSDYLRSTYTALVNDHIVVCEGYAKSFKVLCDEYNVPCILVVGNAGTGATKEAHMYNYVQMDDDKWYLVDVTWDDQTSGTRDDYLLVGSNSIGFNNAKISNSHLYTRTTVDYGFKLPTLSVEEYGVVTHGVGYELNGGTFTGTVQTTAHDGGTISKPIDPVKTGFKFVGWYSDAELTTAYDFNTKVHDDVKLYAKWTVATHTISFNVNGGVGTFENIVKNYGDTVTIPTEVPTKDGFEFNGWNTKVNGTGTNYAGTVKVLGDVTLFAQWTNKSVDPIDDDSEPSDPVDEDDTKPTDPVDENDSEPSDPVVKEESKSLLATVDEFLSGEVIDGVSNKILIGGAAIAIIAILAIAFVARR